MNNLFDLWNHAYKVLCSLFVTLFVLSSAGLTQSEAGVVRIHSPARPPNMMYTLNENIANQLGSCGVAEQFETIASALPDSIVEIAQLSDRSSDWPIVTTVDFEPALSGRGPDWHSYPEANPNLKFIAPLYDVGMGVMVFDEAIRTPEDLRGRTMAVPPRPSSLRVVTETLLGDGWGVLDDVILVDMPPDRVVAAVSSGEVDATFWNLNIEGPEGVGPMLAPLNEQGRWLEVTDEALAQIKAAGNFTLDTTEVPAGDVSAGTDGGTARVLSFKQGLTAWSSTPDEQVLATLECLSPEEGLAAWPGLRTEDVHPAAVEYYDSVQ